MSRSYKREIVFKDSNSKIYKHQAVKVVRRDENIADGKSYKKKYCSYNICDYNKYQGSLENALAEWKTEWKKSSFMRRKFPTWKQAYRYFIANYKYK